MQLEYNRSTWSGAENFWILKAFGRENPVCCVNFFSLQSELEIVDAVMQWVAAAPKARDIHLCDLLACARLYYINNAELSSCFQAHPDYFESPVFRKALGEGLCTKNLLESDSSDVALELVKSNRCIKNKLRTVYSGHAFFVLRRKIKRIFYVMLAWEELEQECAFSFFYNFLQAIL